MTTFAIATLLDSTPRLFHRLLGYWTQFVSGIEEARAMALLYQDLARLSDRELAARGLQRADIPRTVLASVSGR
jgi:hypothetical protein